MEQNRGEVAMLSRIYIRNFVLIRELEIQVGKGLTTVTGETGSGKSLLLSAIALCLGGRVDMKAMEGNEKTVVELEFSGSRSELKAWLMENDLDDYENIVLRREISPQGRSRAFINDTPVTVAQLREVGRFLVDIHGQQENMALQTPGFQRAQLDAFAGISDNVAAFRIKHARFRALVSELEKLEKSSSDNNREEDFLRFQLDEFEKLALQEGELAQLEEELNVLEHAEEIRSGLHNVRLLMENEEKGILQAIRQAQNELQRIAPFAEVANEWLGRIVSAGIELDDLNAEMEKSEGTFELDPGRLQFVRDRLDQVQKLQHKHQAGTEEELRNVKLALQEKLAGIETQDERLEEIRAEVTALSTGLTKDAMELTAIRKKAATSFAKEIEGTTQSLGMPKARLEITLEKLQEFSPTGLDKVTILFNANLGGELRPLGAIASGGEVARVMLAMKAVSTGDEKKTLIFDEIDTGVSGEVALKMGDLMHQIAETSQVLTVTHLPGVAARGSLQWKVYKHEANERTEVMVRELTGDERVSELASMFSGDTKAQATLESARILLSRTGSNSK